MQETPATFVTFSSWPSAIDASHHPKNKVLLMLIGTSKVTIGN